ncbi:aldehyde-activating protein [Hydrogenophaga crassostreae]|uniref:Aldehyde-activating protein n=1 Tax=Hydrogenophaga crassostreae TaxID=1763535 RepID=A0A167HJI9_9BURK|nr:GFA family protein [Hydrogenophaga crassostreae]AOW15347.1 aldehyde-activating protein [Hydrogenophaga crassostreae]OAD41304.1 aldehyde-activating protein [Hydrogenophaga crassostreae]
MPITGGCFCGAVQYQINGRLRDAKSCHCSRCRKAFNAQASATALVDPAEFRWLSGESLLSTYVGLHGYGLQFCSLCGSTLCTVCEGQVFQVSLGCVNGSPDIEIAQHLYVGSKASWEVIPEGVTQYIEAAAPEAGWPHTR